MTNNELIFAMQSAGRMVIAHVGDSLPKQSVCTDYEITIVRVDRMTGIHTTHGTRPHPGEDYRCKPHEISHHRGEYVDVLTNPYSWTVRKQKEGAN